MAKRSYKFCFGPWNLSEGQDPYGPTTRPAQSFDWKLAQLKKHGFDAMMFHDDDAVPDIDTKSETQIRREAKELKQRLDGEGIAAEMVAPRLWSAAPRRSSSPITRCVAADPDDAASWVEPTACPGSW